MSQLIQEPQREQDQNLHRRKTNKELVDYLINTFPDIKEELQFLAGCPERIGIEPLRDILISQTKTSKQVVPKNCEGLSGRTEVWIEL